jgi:hypothetical protein
MPRFKSWLKNLTLSLIPGKNKNVFGRSSGLPPDRCKVEKPIQNNLTELFLTDRIARTSVSSLSKDWGQARAVTRGVGATSIEAIKMSNRGTTGANLQCLLFLEATHMTSMARRWRQIRVQRN